MNFFVLLWKQLIAVYESIVFFDAEFCREALLSFITCGDDVQVSGSLSLLATLLQTKG